ncbi:hypothetical protein, partial [Enterobacter cloacae]|uniref:hypothetical protein n=1 Tax=Enterobacter cloacae TaxID=550 RepID=UPI0023E3A9ED
MTLEIYLKHGMKCFNQRKSKFSLLGILSNTWWAIFQACEASEMRLPSFANYKFHEITALRNIQRSISTIV